MKGLLLPRALFYKEWKSARWGLAGLTLMLLLSQLLRAQRELNWRKEWAQGGHFVPAHHGYWFQDLLYNNSGLYLFVFVAIAALVFLLFQQDRRGATASWLNSMPFTKGQAYDVKWLTGAGIIIGAFLINGILLTAFYFINHDWMLEAPYRVVLIWTGLYLLFSLALYSFFFLVHSAMGHSLAAAVVGPISSLVPAFVMLGLRGVIYYNTDLAAGDAIYAWFSRVSDALAWPYLIAPGYVSDAQGRVLYPVFDNLGGRFLVLGAITVASVLLGRLLYRHNAVEKSGELLMVPALEPVLIYGFALCSGLLLSQLFGLGHGRDGVAMMNTLLGGGFIGGWLAAKKVVLYYRQ
ncbi:MAG TPA: ABC-2 transporter permease [bacterium]|nr:ABC-2 transporter permease [bacterium]